MRRIIQITSSSSNEGGIALFGLDDQGTVWTCDRTGGKWIELVKGLPQEKDATKVPKPM